MSNLETLVQLYKDAFNSIDDFDPEVVEVIVEGDWQQDGKYQHATHIVKVGDDFFAISESRSGSYHTDWYYNDTDISPVERKEETKVVVSWPTTGKSVTVASRY